MTEGKDPDPNDFSSAQMGAIAHLYRGEIYRSTIWRERLDTTTNWSVVTLGVALSITFASPAASPLPLMLVGVLIFLFLMIETRRYRYFNVWRARCRWIENHFYVPMLGHGAESAGNWRAVLAEDYQRPHYHISFMTALGRRVRRNYLWIVAIQAFAFVGKVLVHPAPLDSMAEFYERADVGPVPGELVVVGGVLYVMAFASIALWSEIADSRKWGASSGMGGSGHPVNPR